MGNRITKDFIRPDSKKIKLLEQYSTPDICDASGLYDCMDSRIKPYVTQEKLVGPALTVKVPIGEGGIIPEAAKLAQKGDVLVIAGYGNVNSAYWGDQRSMLAQQKGAIGVIIDGAMRDLDHCEKVGFPVYAAGLTCGSSGKSGIGSINVPVSCGGVVVRPGDIIVADRNGVCVIAIEELDEVLNKLIG